ncbi:MAG: M14-type cytosolic carboxypeptidase [Rikenellaceae bacterium]
MKNLLPRITFAILLLLIVAHSTPVTARGIVHFSSNFEGGALGEVNHIKSRYDGETHYHHFDIKTRFDPKNPVDTKLYPSNRWFYFLMHGVKDSEVSLNIDYNDSRRAMYSYDNKEFIRFTEDESPVMNKTITKRFENDSVYVAYFVPYGIQRYNTSLERWCESPNVKHFTIGESELGQPLDMIVITDKPHEGVIPDGNGVLRPKGDDLAKQTIYIHGRIHPSETPSAWHLEAIVNQLTDGSKASNELLKKCIFYILPCLNPDGVAIGYSRSNANGINMEVNYNEKPEKSAVEILSVKQFLESINSAGMKLDVFLNMHSQSATKTCYWVHRAKSTSKEHNRRLMHFAALTIDNNPYFEWKDICYSNLQPKYLEGWIWEKFEGHTIAQTFETPYTYYSSNPNGEWVDIYNLDTQGANTINAITDALDIGTSYRFMASEPKSTKGFARRKNLNHLYFGSSFQMARKKGAEINYKITLPNGTYSIYRWSVGENAEKISKNTNSWVFHDTIENHEDGAKECNITLNAANRGERFDNLLLIRH